MYEEHNAGCIGQEMSLRPVGVIRSPIQEPILRADLEDIRLCEDLAYVRNQARTMDEMIFEIEIFPQMEELLDGIEDFSHLLVLYWAHLVPEEGRSLMKIHPMGRSELPLKGIFATCSPARPNPVLINAVELLQRNGNVLRAKGLEAVNGTPLLDIKPYAPMYFRVDAPRLPEWMTSLVQEITEDL